MAKSIDPQFYKSRKWQRERELYRREHPFCERCLESGVYKPTDIVHHKKYLKADNYLDSKVSLNSDNLEALCFDCHNKEHIKLLEKRIYCLCRGCGLDRKTGLGFL